MTLRRKEISRATEASLHRTSRSFFEDGSSRYSRDCCNVHVSTGSSSSSTTSAFLSPIMRIVRVRSRALLLKLFISSGTGSSSWLAKGETVRWNSRRICCTTSMRNCSPASKTTSGAAIDSVNTSTSSVTSTSSAPALPSFFTSTSMMAASACTLVVAIIAHRSPLLCEPLRLQTKPFHHQRIPVTAKTRPKSVAMMLILGRDLISCMVVRIGSGAHSSTGLTSEPGFTAAIFGVFAHGWVTRDVAPCMAGRTRERICMLGLLREVCATAMVLISVEDAIPNPMLMPAHNNRAARPIVAGAETLQGRYLAASRQGL
mmetsp:Transcript_50275/g.89762  ORF Transcript_50275/g.89762 Transcript_50275/m.89762 type:complete len:316 (+) Transcript_50275:1869-2816(+)